MYQKIEESTCHVASRKMVSNFAMKDEKNLSEMIELAFDIKHELHVKAFWSMDLVCEKKIKQFVPYIEKFCIILPKITDDSAIRPATKIAFFLSKSNHRKNGISLTQKQEHNLIEALIERLIQDEKVAAKVYAMKALLVLGQKYYWVHVSLKTIISHDDPNQSAAYQVATRNLLKKLNK